ncbi:MAG TPA: ATPase [Acidobacteriaceae bacterium]|jgi:biotin carboxylase
MQTSPNSSQPLIFCLSTYVKGQAFLRECARLGCRVELLTLDKHRDADWPRDILGAIHTMPEEMTSSQIVNTVMYLARSRKIDRIVALDEFDMEIAATLREHMRLPGLGESATRFFRDKLSMRVRAREAGLLVPEFTGIFHHNDLHHWMQQTPAPWMLKPRTDASAIGIRKLHTAEELWPLLDQLGDRQSHHLLEQFVAGHIFHADGVVWSGHTLVTPVHQYGKPPFQLMHQGGVFTTRTVDRASVPAKEIPQLHEKLIAALGLANGVTHTEWIRSAADGQFYFLEAAARVGGAFIADVIEQAYRFSPWVEWARIEVALARGEQYSLPQLGSDYAGSVLCLARHAMPVTDRYDAPEIVHRMQKHHHAGLIVCSSDPARVEALTEEYARRFAEDFLAIAPAPAKATA